GLGHGSFVAARGGPTTPPLPFKSFGPVSPARLIWGPPHRGPVTGGGRRQAPAPAAGSPDRRPPHRAARDHCGRRRLDRRPDLRVVAGGTPAVRLFPQRPRGLYSPRPGRPALHPAGPHGGAPARAAGPLDLARDAHPPP